MELIKLTTYKDKYYVTNYSLPEFIQELEDMEVRKDDIFVVTYPKSGKCVIALFLLAFPRTFV